MSTLRVATFNLRNARALDGIHSWPFRRRTTAAVVDHLDADVIGLQEAYRCQERYLLRHLGGHDGVGAGRTDGRRGERCPVLVRRSRFRVERSRTRWFAERPDVAGSRLPGASFPRIATMAELRDLLTGEAFAVANLHLDERVAANRLASVELLVSWLDQSLAWIVLGDFNAGSGTEELHVLEAAGFRSVLGEEAGGTAHGFTLRTDGPRIDHILVRPEEWRVVSAAVDTWLPGRRPASDHWAVVATLARRPTS